MQNWVMSKKETENNQKKKKTNAFSNSNFEPEMNKQKYIEKMAEKATKHLNCDCN
jgi:hypothetical protein